MRSVSDKSGTENKNIISYSIIFFRISCRLWDNVENTVEPDRTQMAIWRMSLHAGLLRLQTHTHNMQYLLL